MMDLSRESGTSEWARGWQQVFVGVTGSALGCTAIYFYSQGLFIKALQGAFGWSRGQAAAMPMIFNLALALITPFYGLLVDRYGMRPVTMFSIICFALGFWALSQMQGDLASFYGIILFIALLGGGTSSMPYIRLVGGWFEKSRGLAIGVTTTGSGLAALLIPPLLGAYMQGHGWRAAYQALALLAFLALPIVLLLAKEKPRVINNVPVIAPGMTVAEAIRTRRFWQLGITFGLAGAAVSGLITHFIPMMQDSGMTLQRAGATFGIVGVAIVGGRLLTGFVVDRVFAPYVAATVFFLSALGCIILALLGIGFAIPAGILIGLCLGAEIDLVGYMSARYFGLRSYGGIIGLQYGLFSFGASTAPFINGLLYDHFGNYTIALLGAAGILLLGIVSILLLGRYPTLSAPVAE